MSLAPKLEILLLQCRTVQSFMHVNNLPSIILNNREVLREYFTCSYLKNGAEFAILQF